MRLVYFLVFFAFSAQAQERTFTITLTERELFYLGALLDEQKIKDGVAIYNKIDAQLGLQKRKAEEDARAAFEKMVRDKVAAEQKATEDQKRTEP